MADALAFADIYCTSFNFNSDFNWQFQATFEVIYWILEQHVKLVPRTVNRQFLHLQNLWCWKKILGFLLSFKAEFSWIELKIKTWCWIYYYFLTEMLHWASSQDLNLNVLTLIVPTFYHFHGISTETLEIKN